MQLTPYFRNGVPTSDVHDALLPVRVAEALRPTGYVVAYTRNGTALEVLGHELLRLDVQSSERRARGKRWRSRVRRLAWSGLRYEPLDEVDQSNA
jgi:hypothetical protein